MATGKYPIKKQDFVTPQGATEVSSEKWEDAEYATKMSYERTKQGREGIRILSAKKSNYKSHYGVWLDKKVNYPVWFNWFAAAFKKVAKLFGKEVETPEDAAKRYQEELDETTRRLVELRRRYELAVQALQEQEMANKLAKELSANITACEKGLAELKGLINQSFDANLRMESPIKKKIVENKWVLGLDCEVKAKEKGIDSQASIDLHIVTDLGEDRIFEFKSPNIRAFTRKDNGKTRFLINPEIAEGINQLIIYLKKVDFWSKIKEEGVHGIPKPAGVIVTGYKVSEEEMDIISNWNFHLRPHIRIVTYDVLLRSAEHNLELIRRARQFKNKGNETIS